MTPVRNRPDVPDEPMTEREFREALGDLILAAEASGINLRDGWFIPGEGGPHDFDVQISRVVKDQDP
jgi:hypothetical protein